MNDLRPGYYGITTNNQYMYLGEEAEKARDRCKYLTKPGGQIYKLTLIKIVDIYEHGKQRTDY